MNTGYLIDILTNKALELTDSSDSCLEGNQEHSLHVLAT